MLACLVLLLPRTVATEAVRLLEADDAFVDRAETGDAWTIGNSGVALTVGFDAERTLVAQTLINRANGRSWITAGPDALLSFGGRSQPFSARAMLYDGVEVHQRASGVELAIRFHSADRGIRISRHYACYPTAPVVESWTTFEPIDEGRTFGVRDLDALELSLPPGIVRWVTGLQVSDQDGGAFSLQRTDLRSGGTLSLGADGRASERALPWFLVEVGHDELFGGLLWAGAWSLDLAHANGRISASLKLPPFATVGGPGPLETPHAYVGVVSGSMLEASEAARAFFMAGLRQGRPLSPLVTYNTWFAYGTTIDEAQVSAEMTFAASVGVERFVVDAGWYRGNQQDPSDFTSGLGSWEVDADRFPSGLGALSDRAHALGMQFGIWVEPERVDLQTVGKPGLARERWLATQNGRYDPALSNAEVRSAQVCFADREAREWVLAELSGLIDAARPDYLKWDNNYWLNCTRPSHGHGSTDGNFAHVRGLEAVLAALRQRYPDLLIENCAGGGNRLEPGMLAWTDTAWMDDRTQPAAHVRHNLEGLSVVMPPASLLSFAVGGEWNATAEYDVPLALRSRMPGVLGLTWRASDIAEADAETIRRELRLYKDLRSALSDASARLLTPQATDDPSGRWDVLQESSRSTGETVLFAFQNPGAAASITVHPRGIDPDRSYQVSSADAGGVSLETGADLLRDGVVVVASSRTRAQVIRLRPVPDARTDGGGR